MQQFYACKEYSNKGVPSDIESAKLAGSGGVQSNSPNLVCVDEDAGSLVGVATVVGGREDGEEVSLLLELGGR